MATVKFSDEMPKPNSIKGTDRFLISDGDTGEAKAPDFDQAKEFLNITSNDIAPLVGGETSGTALVVNAGPLGQTRRADVASGKWYNFGTGAVEATEDRQWKAYWDGSSWFLIDMGALPQPELANVYGTGTGIAISQAKATETNNKVQQVTTTGATKDKVFYNSIFSAGYVNTDGSLASSNNWIKAYFTEGIVGGKEYSIKGFGNTATSLVNGTYPRIIFYKDTPNAAGFLGSVLGDGTIKSEIKFTTPANTNRIIVVLDGYTGAGLDLPNSPFHLTFTFFETIENPNGTIVDSSKIVNRIDSDQLVAIESAISNIPSGGNSFYDGDIYPKLSLGINDDKYINTSIGRLYIKKNGDWGTGIYMGDEQAFVFPSEFTWRPFDIVRQGNGKYVPAFKSLFAQFVKADYDRLTKYYVDPINGNDSNNGLTKTTAFKDIKVAVEGKGARNIELLPVDGDFYPYNLGLRSILDIATSEPLIIIAPKPVILANSMKGNTFTWTDQGGYYKTSRTNVRSVVDKSVLDGSFYRSLKLVNSATEVGTTPNSWYIAGADLYVNCGRVPDVNIELVFGIDNTYTPSVNIPYMYMEGVHVVNPVSPTTDGAIRFLNNTTTQFNTKIILSNVKSFHNYLGNGLAINNIKEAFLEDCAGYGNFRDSLNYHTTLLSSGYAPMKVVEIAGKGFNNGLGTTEDSSNGSTMHEGGTIIRFWGDFGNTRGAIIADVMPGIRSLNFNTSALNNVRENDTAFRISGVGSIGWYFGCIGESSSAGTVSIKADEGGTGYYSSDTKIPNGVSGNVIAI